MNLNRENMIRMMQLILFTVVVLAAALNYNRVILLLARGIGLLFPFLLGAAVAFVLNVPMRFLERHIHFKENSRLKRPVCMVIAIVLVFTVLGVVILLVVPEITRTVRTVAEQIPVFFSHLQQWANVIFVQYPELLESINRASIDWGKMVEELAGFIHAGAGDLLSSTMTAAGAIVSGITSVFIGFVFAVYILLQKEVLCRQFKKLIQAFLPARAEAVFRVAALTERTFSKFLAGQCVEAVILGTMFFLVLTFCRLPYALLIGVLIAFTALIPVFGAFIGWFIGAFLMLMVNPLQALIFSVIFLILQQIEGNLIYPHVVGNSVGLPSIWVLAAVTLGGSMMGILGMLIFIPLCSVAYTLLKEKVNRNLERQAKREEEHEKADS